jgi:hypothetical protein
VFVTVVVVLVFQQIVDLKSFRVAPASCSSEKVDAAVSTTADSSDTTSITCLTDGCYHVFVDAGSNRGVHGRFLFEPKKYPRSKFATVKFPEVFGPGDRAKQNICVLALEPNPRHAQVQTATSTAYGWMGWKYHFLPYAVSDQEGILTFYRNRDVKGGGK